MIMVFTLTEQHLYGAPATYLDDEQAPVGVLPGLTIDLPAVFAE